MELQQDISGWKPFQDWQVIAEFAAKVERLEVRRGRLVAKLADGSWHIVPEPEPKP